MEKKQLLLVEDNQVIATLFQESLEEFFGRVDVTLQKSAEEAGKLIDSRSWDLIVTDQNLPKQTGLQLIRSHLDRLHNTRWILITAFGTEELEQEAQSLGVFRFMRKPFLLTELQAVVMEALGLHQTANNVMDLPSVSIRGFKKS
jgi:DNA-binding NtrC family response regulator